MNNDEAHGHFIIFWSASLAYFEHPSLSTVKQCTVYLCNVYNVYSMSTNKFLIYGVLPAMLTLRKLGKPHVTFLFSLSIKTPL
jgi:hypothetical protein